MPRIIDVSYCVIDASLVSEPRRARDIFEFIEADSDESVLHRRVLF